MVRGSCLCRSVTWEVPGAFRQMAHCHCSMCRKSHGTAFQTYAVADAEGFQLTSGEDRITSYASSPGWRRAFCSVCGSVTPTEIGAHVAMPAGCLDDDPGVRPQMHVFVGSKAPWYEITDALPQHDASPPDWDAPDLPERELDPPSAPGRVRGSCLCGGVAFELGGTHEVIVHCHCSRCRKSRAAAHNANLFMDAADFRFVRGQELIRTYKLPDAERFHACFCRVCGSGLPRLVQGQARIAVPAGALDDDPGARPRLHFFTGSKAPWYDVPPGLPQFEEYPPERG